MNSCFSLNTVRHSRFFPKKHKFDFNFFWFHIDLDEIDDVVRKNRFISYNKFNLYSLYDKDHWYEPNITIKENVIKFITMQGFDESVSRITLVSSLRFLGYVFNPVSYYFIDTKEGSQYCLIQICNTFKELKPIFIKDKAVDSKFRIKCMKDFYVSPFTEIHEEIEFNIKNTKEQLRIVIHSYNKKAVELTTVLNANKVALNSKEVLLATFWHPFVTLQIIFIIHFQALLLFLKGLKYKKKTDDIEFQRGVIPWRM